MTWRDKQEIEQIQAACSIQGPSTSPTLPEALAVHRSQIETTNMDSTTALKRPLRQTTKSFVSIFYAHVVNA